MFHLMAGKREHLNGGLRYPGLARSAGLLIMLIGILAASYEPVWGQSEKSNPRMPPPKGFRASGAPETYGPDTLYQKINGQAELYLSAGFISLQSQWYEAIDDAHTIIEVNLYNMGSLMNAFSIFTLQRRDAAQPIDVTPFAYQTDGLIHMVHGPFYVEILSSPPSEKRMPLLKQMAEQFVRETPFKNDDLHLLSLFPPKNLVNGSASMIAGNAFGFELLDHVFTVEYDTAAGRSTAYVSKRETAQEARMLVNGLRDFFVQYGGRTLETDIDVKGAQMVEIMGTFEVMFSFGAYIAGVHEAPDRKQAETHARLLANSLKEKTPKRHLDD